MLTDANLAGSTRFYVLAAPTVGSNFAIGRRARMTELPLVTQQEGFASDSIDLKITLEVALAAVDWKFGATGAGA